MKVVLWLFLSAYSINGMAAGKEVNCFDYRYIKVHQAPMLGLDGIAKAGVMRGGHPIILYDPQAVFSVGKQTEWFIFLHECAHHVLAHTTTASRIEFEQAADCWAIKKLSTFIGFSQKDLQLIQQQLIFMGVEDATHQSGRQRAENLQYCDGYSTQIAMGE